MMQDWKRRRDPQISIVTAKGAKVLAIGVVEDFVYLNCSSSSSTLQVTDKETNNVENMNLQLQNISIRS